MRKEHVLTVSLSEMYMLVSLPWIGEIDHDFLATWAATDQLTSFFAAVATPETIFAAPDCSF